MDAVLGKQTFTEVQIVNPVHPPLIATEKLKANQGELSSGLILAEDSNGEKVPYKNDYSQVIGTGDGTVTSFSGTLTNKPVCHGSVTVTADTVTLVDDDNGNLKGSGGSGYLNYKTGEISVTFTDAPANAVNVTVVYANKPVGVLIRGVDTAKDTAGEVLCHGVAVRSNLKVGLGAPAEADIKRLEPAIFAW